MAPARSLPDVNRLIKQFAEMQKVMRQDVRRRETKVPDVGRKVIRDDKRWFVGTSTHMTDPYQRPATDTQASTPPPPPPPFDWTGPPTFLSSPGA